jgi:predicted NBD/HSP70 family sugar kinase
MLLGIDLGGTKIEGIVLKHRDSLDTLARVRVPTEGTKGYDHVIGQIVLLVDKLKAETGFQPSHIGIGTPGALEPATQLLKNSNTTALNGRPLKKDLEKALGLEVRIANDANCFAVAEANLGVVKERYPNAETVFGIIMGTGVGGGLVVNGKVINGRHGIAGEWGHNPLEPVVGTPCYCGKIGCVETVFAGPFLQKFYTKHSGMTLSLPEIVQRYHGGQDLAAAMTMQRLFEQFGKAVSVVINILDPDVIVIGGGVGNIDEIYTLGVAEVKKHIFNTRVDTLFLKPSLGDSAGVFGAALL